MSRVLTLLLALLPVAACAQLPPPGTPGAPADSRYCGEPERYADGTIKRDRAVIERFKEVWPKPDDGQEWHVDHVIPRAMGGCDMGHNLQWLPTAIKSCAGTVCKDRWERRVYRTPR